MSGNMNALDAIITKVMLQLGFSPSMNGFYFLRDAVKLALNEPSSLTLITKLIYAPLAKSYKTTSSNIEKSIRTASAAVWNNNFPPKNAVILNNVYYYSEHKPENRELIALICDFVKKSGEIFNTDIGESI